MTSRAHAAIAMAVVMGAFAAGGVACGGKTTLDTPTPTPSASPTTTSTVTPYPTPSPYPTDEPSPAPEPEPLPTVGPIPANTCVTFLGAIGVLPRFASIDLTTGAVTKGISVKLSSDFSYDTMSIAVLDDEVLFCEIQRITRVSRKDGSASFIEPHGCEAITADAGGITVMYANGKPLRHFANVSDLKTNQWDAESTAPTAVRLGSSPDGIIASMHAADQVFTSSGWIHLEGYDDYIDGLSGAPGRRTLIASPRASGGRPGLLAFDAFTGKSKGVVAMAPPDSWNSGLGFKGLACAY